MTTFTSTARRREVGAGLRRIRESRGINGMEMAHRLNWHPSMLSRAETGKRPVSEREVILYLGVCGITDGQLQELLDLIAEPDDYRLKAHLGRIPDELRTLIFHEQNATTIEEFQLIYIPGLLQTEDYARALFSEGGLEEPEAIEGCVRTRLARRSAITKLYPTQCQFLVHENALRSMTGSPRIMNDQMLHLVFVSDRPQCSIRVVPRSAGSRGSAGSPFQIFGFAEDTPVVCVQNETTSTFLENCAELRSYRNLVNRLARVALTDAESRSYIASVASEYERQGVAGHAEGVAEE